MEFDNSTSADHGTFTIHGGGFSNSTGGAIDFFNSSTAASAVFTVEGGAADSATGGFLTFVDSSSAGGATLTADAGAAGAQGGLIRFFNTSSGGTATIKVLGNGALDISDHNAPGLTIGSVEGDGPVFLFEHEARPWGDYFLPWPGR